MPARWVESHITLRAHPKRKRLSRLLGLNVYETIGLLMMFWWWISQYAPEGDLRGFSDEDIADAIDFDGDAAVLLAALTRAGFVDADRYVHDWYEYHGVYLDKRQADAERAQKNRDRRKNGLLTDLVPDVRATSGERPADFDHTGQPTGNLNQPTGQPDTYNPRPLLPQAGAGETFPDDVIDRLSALPVDLSSAAFHDAAESALTSLGFACQREVWLPDRGTGRRGRLDLLAERRGITLALELDNRSPESGSLLKLRFIDATFRAIVLRNPADRELPSPPDGIVLIGAGRRDQGRRRSRDDAQGSREDRVPSGRSSRGPQPSTPPPEVIGVPSVPPDLVPATDADRELWLLAAELLTKDWLPANREKIEAYELLGRGTGGELWLRAPPWVDLGASKRPIAWALVNAGDDAGANVVIVEG